jgi:hypothetical protein
MRKKKLVTHSQKNNVLKNFKKFTQEKRNGIMKVCLALIVWE